MRLSKLFAVALTLGAYLAPKEKDDFIHGLVFSLQRLSEVK